MSIPIDSADLPRNRHGFHWISLDFIERLAKGAIKQVQRRRVKMIMRVNTSRPINAGYEENLEFL